MSPLYHLLPPASCFLLSVSCLLPSASCLLVSASCLVSSALPLPLFNDRLAVERHGAAAKVTACVERCFVIATGPLVVSRADADHSRLHPIPELARGPNFHVRIDTKIDVAQIGRASCRERV